MTPGPGIEPGTHWWKASALTTAPTLLPIGSQSDREFTFSYAILQDIYSCSSYISSAILKKKFIYKAHFFDIQSFRSLFTLIWQ